MVQRPGGKSFVAQLVEDLQKIPASTAQEGSLERNFEHLCVGRLGHFVVLKHMTCCVLP